MVARPWLAHFEFQSSADHRLIARLLRYCALLHHREPVPIESIAVLLRPTAESAGLTGTYHVTGADGGPRLEFRYSVVRVWEQPVDDILRGSLAWLPLAPLASGADANLPDVLRRVDQRLRVEVPPGEVDRLWTATYWMAGLRYTEEEIAPLFERMRAVRDSATYQAAVAEGRAAGRAEEARRWLLLLGEQRFGPPDDHTRRALTAMTNLERLERLRTRLLQATDWDDLIATP